MGRLLAIIENTFKEGLRQRILLLLVVFSVLMIVVSIFLGPFALGETPKIIRDFGLGIASLFSILVTIIIGSSLLHKDIEKRTLYTVVTKPVKRSEIILGKFLGLFMLIAILMCSMAVIHQIVLVISEGKPDFILTASVPFALLEIAVMLGILLFFSSFTSTTLTSIMGVLFYIIGRAAPDLVLFAEQTTIPPLKYAAYAFYYVLPNLENFNFRAEFVYRLPLCADQVVFSICYGVVYTIFLLLLSVCIFEHREFK
jgi:ABC-type transport system involved in multi-copper enzyme maturation permease subunit